MKKVEPQNISKTGKLLTISSAKVTQSPTLQQDAYIKRNFFGFSNKKKKGMILKAQVKTVQRQFLYSKWPLFWHS